MRLRFTDAILFDKLSFEIMTHDFPLPSGRLATGPGPDLGTSPGVYIGPGPTGHVAIVMLLLCQFMLPATSWAQSDHSFQVARVKYGGGGDWYSDPESLPELLKFVRIHTEIDVSPREETVELSSDNLYSFPYLYMTGHGNVRLNDREATRLRRYLDGGGFLHIDDNYGLDEPMRREMKKVYPEKEFVELPFTHEIYHTQFDFPQGLPKIHEHDGNPAQGFGIVSDTGRLLVFYSFESDLGDGWEPESVHNDSPEKRLAALQMGTNILAYAMMN
jgi:Domain of unknown function (DUF4159)